MHLTAALARRLERANAARAVDVARIRQQLLPEADIRVAELAGGLAVTSVVGGRSSSRAFALGSTHRTQGQTPDDDAVFGPVTVDDVEAVERFFHGTSHPPTIAASPFSHPSLFEALAARGFRIYEFDAVLGLDAERPAISERAGSEKQGPACCTIRLLAPDNVHNDDEADVVARVVVGALGQAHDTALRLTIAPLLMPPTRTFAAFVDGEPVGIGSVCHVPEDGVDVALLFAGMTVTSARGRGVQRALLEARVDDALSRGAQVVTSRAEPGSSSERNMRRAGLRGLYTSTIFIKS